MRTLQREAGPDLHIRVSGDLSAGRPVLLVHGMGGDHRTWRATAAMLRRGGRPVVSFDLRGHGHSGRTPNYLLADFAADAQVVVDALNIERADVIGHSLGAHTALRLAMARPELVDHLILEEVPPMARDASDLAEPVVMAATLGERVRGLLALARDPRPILRFDRAMADQVVAQFDNSAPDWWADLARVSAPTLVISGGDRSFLPTRHLQSLADALPDGRLVAIDAGHSVHRDARGEFLSAAAEFLAVPR
ncbi:alpha/beta fold hydrolase [Gordonia sp. ABSL1-1]|uniref:alpha/beta fold hydrolase n=1 Tax=Gordonia sp. ABSL1-1 TaxID=3053923 RepID=UPI002572CB86|nr:alpha/beta fold hydrolase [Gordonia sp. ABSL1-1]MDL9937880.1 alpha/beta fold hydrolase [Gordonia sp. ABSL1-1]